MNKNNIIILVVTIIVLGLAFSYLFNSGVVDTSSSLSSQASYTVDVNAKEILKLLTDMDKVVLNDSVFKLPVFQSLKDTSVVLVSQPVGRLNPFAPMNPSEISISTASSTKK